MSTAPESAVQSAPSTQTEPSRGSQRRRRPRNRGRPNTQPARQEDAPTQTGTPPQTETPTQTPAIAQTQQPAQRGGRGGRGRGRGRGRGGIQEQPRFPHRIAGGRQFGGQLTLDDNEDAASVTSGQEHSSLQADAPEFQPGRPIPPRKQRPPRQKKPQAPKSTAADIATRTHEDIDNGHYECAICTEEIKRHHRGVWSCRTCWTVFHLSCIKKWSTNEGSAAARQQAADGELPPPRQWRCPGCNLPKDVLPKSFSCWCEKELEPKSLPGLPPFSCGQTCARPRLLPKKCPHPCPTTCHAGPCPPCTLMGPTQNCFCGRKSLTRRCVDTDYENGWSCGDVCGKVMPCGEHYCSQPCHEGSCGVCEVRIPARCYCGQVQKDILCCDKGDERQSSQSHLGTDGSAVTERWTGLFECPNPCGRPFDCGKHVCEKSCHQRDAEPAHCPQSPDLVSHCPCGKTPLNEISNVTRYTCEDPIPYCTKPCGKSLPCGHGCTQPCHRGDCMPCLKSVSISCRCGRTTSSTVCHQGIEEPPQCMRVCRISLNCGRHECGERCCSGERKAAERQSNRRKPRPLNAPRQPDEGFEAEHICTRSCRRQLKCGNPEHRCQELCHKGACGTCRDAIFEELSCHCGRTVLQPPLPCGTNPPPCRFLCERPKDCGHPQVAHSCHQDEESCPKCPFLTVKPCLCGKSTLKNQPCWLSEVRCGEVCGRTLKCGTHKCQKQCHRPGECEDPCQQRCGKELSVCGHPCMAPCHFPALCKENKPCQQKILVTCECQRIKQEAKCAASTSTEGNLKKVLKCDDECARLERNRKLALALNVDPATHQNDHVPYSSETLQMYQENSTWAAAQEKQLRLFAADPEEKRLRFKPMPRQQRAFLHSLSEDFGFDSESMDPEPHRHVAIFKTPRFVMAPMKTLAECARVRQVQRVVPPAPSSAMNLRLKPSTNVDPYNSFLITNPRFALTIEEVNAVVKSVLSKSSLRLELEVNFLPSEEVALKPPIVARLSVPEREMQAMLESVKSALSQAITAQKLGKLQLARLDASLNVLRKESDAGPGSGWSHVAAKGAPMRRMEKAAPLGTKGGFAVLSLSTTKKKKEKAAEVVDDWEAAEEIEEEKERVSGVNSGVPSEDEGAASHSRVPSSSNPPSEEFLMTTKPSSERWSDLDQD